MPLRLIVPVRNADAGGQGWIERGVRAGSALAHEYRTAPGRDLPAHDGHYESGLAQRWTDAWNSHDADTIADLHARDVVYEDVPLRLIHRGRRELRAVAASFLAGVPDLRLDLAGSSVSEDEGYIEWVMSGSDRGLYHTGNRFRIRGTSIVFVRGGRISRNVDLYDLASLLRQVGLLPRGL
ncbi:MAG: hypothetical protein NVS1B4_10660 [Gemmatimonadaceae bacterium]